MKIHAHSESHIVEFDDGSKWQIFPGDLDITLNWTSEAEFILERTDDEVGSHALVDLAGNTRVRVIPLDAHWRVKDVKTFLKDG